MGNITIYCDIDGCLRDLVGACDRLYEEKFPTEHPVVSKSYLLSERYPRWGEDTRDIIFWQHVNRVFNHDAKAYSGAVEGINWVHSLDDVEIKLLSKQNALRGPVTDAWLDQVEIDSTIERHYVGEISKGEYLLDLGISGFGTTFVIDDSPDQIESIDETGISNCIPVLVIREWNELFRERWQGAMITDVTTKSLLSLITRLGEY